MMKIRRGLAILLSVSLAVIALVAINAVGEDDRDVGTDGEVNQPGAIEVRMLDISFVPETLTVSPGAEVTWINDDAVPHTVRSGMPGTPTDVISSGRIAPGETFSQTFMDTMAEVPDTIPYFCEIHPNTMTGVLIIEPE